MIQHPLFPGMRAEKQRAKPSPNQIEALARIRLSKNFIPRDFLYSTECAARGLSNYPEDPGAVVRAGKALCEKVLEPVTEHFGRPAITFAYQSRECIDYGLSKAKREEDPHSSNPHSWDRRTFGDEVYARIDILPYCVEDGLVTKREFGYWLMHNLDLDLVMQWRRSNVFCITISPRPRRVWLGWGSSKLGEPKQEIFIGADYWQRVYPGLSEQERPKFAPSCTGGSLQWRR